ncbi:MAG: membrane protein insertion efficiency factor YidD [Bacteroidetes bacterium CG_4_9_14_3_um_filter_41_19]|nr:MAG: membrane protein insertion efficiency factor YidD [Bacteroidetes bacterium CG_4_9_14_3_um_filter_41_19]
MMKFVLLSIIRTYWFLVPKAGRRKCIFHTSCSNYVYEITRQKGFKPGMQSLLFRIKTCNPEFDIFTDQKTGRKKMLLRTGQIVDELEIAKRLM